MLRRILLIVVGLAVVGLAAFWLITMPKKVSSSELAAGYQANLANGEVMFNAANCSACHMTPGQSDRLRLAGGLKLESPFGAFLAPNISPDKAHGIGDWSEADMIGMLSTGTDRCFNEPEGMRNVLASTALLPAEDQAAMAAYIKTIPAKAGNGKEKTC